MRERARQQVFDVEAAEYIIKSVGFGAGMIWAEVITTYTLSDNCQITLIFDVQFPHLQNAGDSSIYFIDLL